MPLGGFVAVNSPLLPGSTIGILGSGQLGRMLAIAAKQLGYRVAIYSPETNTPAGQVADVEAVGDYLDEERLADFAQRVSVITFEFENVPSRASEVAAQHTIVRPTGSVLHITQERLREKAFLRDHGFPTTPFCAVKSYAELRAATRELGLPAVLKTASFGYDGKGQQKVYAQSDLERVFAALGGAVGIYEAWVDFEKEISVVAARTADGQFAAYPVFENRHAHHILDVTFAPATISPQLAKEATDLAAGILEKLGVIGLLTVEMFVTKSGELLVNELAPRTHNSGHLTIDACTTSQFEQQIRAVCCLPLGSTALRHPAAMANLLGDVWSKGEPNWAAALRDPDVKLHLYGKAEARKGRKMGHLTAGALGVEAAIERVILARERLLS